MSQQSVWTDITIELPKSVRPFVCPHSTGDVVSLSVPGYEEGMNGMGFTLRLTPSHIPQIEKLLEELQNLKTAKEVVTSHNSKSFLTLAMANE